MDPIQISALNVLKEHSVIYLGDIAYYVRNRVEVRLQKEFRLGSLTSFYSARHH